MSLTDEAIERIKTLIASGELGPGSRLPPEQDLAAKLALSRNSLREAVRALVLVRVLDVRRGDGTYVTSLEPKLLLEGMGLAVELLRDDTLLEVVEVRRLLEPATTALAASRVNEGRLADLRLCLERMRQAQGDAERLVVHDAAFHDCVVEATGNQTLASVLSNLSGQTVRARVWRAMIEGGAAALTITQHEDIYAALAAGDSRLAEAAALVHVTTSETWLRKALDVGRSAAGARSAPPVD